MNKTAESVGLPMLLLPKVTDNWNIQHNVLNGFIIKTDFRNELNIQLGQMNKHENKANVAACKIAKWFVFLVLRFYFQFNFLSPNLFDFYAILNEPFLAIMDLPMLHFQPFLKCGNKEQCIIFLCWTYTKDRVDAHTLYTIFLSHSLYPHFFVFKFRWRICVSVRF